MDLEQIKIKQGKVLTFDQEGAVPARGDWAEYRQSLMELLEEDIPMLIERVENAEKERIEAFKNGYDQGRFDEKMDRY
ncbi:hypothetical protein V7111_23080 [Neobacillus niacini]|uniref:hypothetical protein n=1 Tax=Neobacillus niacini TaxID=86668 RepID=UPI00300154C1